ncbi:MAG: MarR family transcriptional regulator [Candidatus Methylophosphatis roskildensis]|uniref:MarR family transcriptional regulator n=1 Tax=Candidatus Methylophosphatis roskildensis TaxID=2899263 RepID=A0A9D7HNL4_9PROT|nr:MarR family transcriptional regulator [Candidatus Methylophosphatis roskildensis]MBK7237420.1 MarR family transcriptional regulator [Sterolibacteriaceae bacterium]MBK7663875.1 MarR family transcriptional regulator [Sterolibacteriaceae bacterium]MBK9084213.1 MarR family transcriptional regulator [Sterolibacteriaceae bacterium]
MLINDTDRGIGFLLTETARLFRQLIDRRLHPLGLTRAQWSVLAILSNRDGLSQSQLAEALEVEKTTAGRLIDHVEKSGWVERRPIPGDRRVWGVYLTDRARPLIADVERVVLSVRAEILSDLSPTQQHELAGVLQLVKSRISLALSVDQSGSATHQTDDGKV